MLNFFSGKSRPAGHRRSSSSKSLNVSSYGQSMTLANQVAGADAEHQIHRFDMPTQQRGMTDLIASHKTGERFQYVALTGADVEDYSSRIRRLVQLTPRVSKNEISQKDLPRLRLFGDAEKFPLSSAIPGKGKEFVQLNRATIIFTPLSSFADRYTVIKMSLMDMRKRTDQERSSVKANTNVQSKIEFSLDYCVPRSSLNQVFLLVNREQSTFNEGEMWGVIQVQLELIETDYPYMENMREVVGVLSLPSSGLDKFEKDPQHLDITMHNNHRIKMQELYSNGEITNETEPIQEKTMKVKYAKSSISAVRDRKQASVSLGVTKEFDFTIPKQVPPDYEHKEDLGNWDQINLSKKPEVSDDQISYSVPDDDSNDSNWMDKESKNNTEINKSGFKLSKSDESLPLKEDKFPKTVNFKTTDV